MRMEGGDGLTIVHARDQHSRLCDFDYVCHGTVDVSMLVVLPVLPLRRIDAKYTADDEMRRASG
jgi:hypothetical protein